MNATQFPSAPSLERIAVPTWIALATMTVGWFWMATLVTTFGPIQQVVHFYDLGTVLRDPSWLVHGAGESHTPGALAFGTLSAAVILAPLAAHRLDTRSSRLLFALPLALMVSCGILLYFKTAQPYAKPIPNSGALGAFMTRVANDVIGQATNTIARHISVGLGGYLSFGAALYLTLKGVRGYAAKRRMGAD
jgi:hypothetical protein